MSESCRVHHETRREKRVVRVRLKACYVVAKTKPINSATLNRGETVAQLANVAFMSESVL